MSDQPSVIREQTDEELIAAFQEGNVPSFNLLVGRYKDQLLNFVFRYLGDYDEADDVVQETFIRVYQRKHLYKPVAKFSTWLYTIATNLAKTRLRQRKRHALFSLSHRGRDQEERDYEIPDYRYPADGEATRAIQQERIQSALDAIPAKYREVVILCDIQEMTYDEICEVTGLNMGTVKSRLNRGRAQLQKLLRDLMED